jgi:dihydroorotate dehydrogenase subfamily 1
LIVTDDEQTSDVVQIERMIRRVHAGQAITFAATCGSNRLLSTLQRLTAEFGIPGEIALEQHMGCAIGACFFFIGIPSKGSDYYINETAPFYRRYAPPLVASISANSIEEFGELAAKISVPGVRAIEANISCPNLKKDGRAFGMDPEATYQVVKAMKAATSVLIWPKMTPNAGNVVEVACAAEKAGADALVVSNAILAMAIDVEPFRPRLANVMGGLTGSATRPIMLRIAYQIVQVVSIPVIGCGGIGSASDALEFPLAGCSAVQVSTANFVSPTTMPAPDRRPHELLRAAWHHAHCRPHRRGAHARTHHASKAVAL